jgi:hypothetical protein
MGQNDFDVAWAEGAALSTEEAIAYAQRGRGERKRPATGWASLTPAELDASGWSVRAWATRTSPQDFSSHHAPSANRDPAVCDDPDRLDISRVGTSPIQTFGGGMHYCLGADLARLELAEALAVMARRMPNARRTGPAPWKPVNALGGPITRLALRHLRITLTSTRLSTTVCSPPAAINDRHPNSIAHEVSKAPDGGHSLASDTGHQARWWARSEPESSPTRGSPHRND